MPRQPTTTTTALATFAADLTIAAIPGEVRARVKDYLLDAIASAVFGLSDPDAARVRALGRDVMGTGSSTVIGGGGLSLAGATIVNSYLTTAASICDIHYPSWCHVAPEVIPPALAVAEARDASGQDLLVAITAGLEVAVRIGLGLHLPSIRARGWYAPGIAGTFGAATSSGHLLGLDRTLLEHALGIAGSQASGSDAQHGSSTIKFIQARAATSGLIASSLAADGLTAMGDVLGRASAGVFDLYSGGGNPTASTSLLGSDWELMRISLRPWPVAAFLLNVVSTAIELGEREPVDLDDVSQVRIFLSQRAFSRHGSVDFHDPASGRLSPEFLACLALRDKRCDFDQFNRSDESELVRYAQTHATAEPDASLPDQATRIEVRRSDGTIQSHARPVAHGHADDPLTRPEIIAKFETACRSVLSDERAQDVVDLVSSLEARPTIGPLMDALRPAVEFKSAASQRAPV